MSGTESTDLTRTQGVNMASSAIVSAAGAYSKYNRVKHDARMADLNYRHNKAMVLENLKINQYIVGRNKIDMLDASEDEKMSIAIETMKARADVTVAHAAFGMEGGSAQQVLHSISREAEKAESRRLYSLDSALFKNKMQLFSAASGALTQIGIRPVGGVSGALIVGSAAAEFGSKLREISRDPTTRST